MLYTLDKYENQADIYTKVLRYASFTSGKELTSHRTKPKL